jgi:SAM-dependent methyltransferase
VAFIYPAVGIGFALLDSGAGPARLRFWRLAAWLVSALAFALHLVYEQRRRLTSPLRTASHVSIAVALGAFVLAIWVLAHGRWTGAAQSSLAPLALVVFPLVTGIPAFAVALVAARLASPERSGTPADDPFGGRRPTSHERMTGRPWDASYHDGPAPWGIGRPQPAVVRLASEGGIAGAVLDAGCGTGENALHVASLGFSVLGVDVAETALAIAREKADDRGIEVELAAADVFELERLGRTFGTVLDCGLFHTFDRDERPGYVASLASVTEHGGTLYVLCFSDEGPDTGPHPISQEELRAAFNPGNGWNVAAIEPERVQTRYHADGAPAWLATIKRI